MATKKDTAALAKITEVKREQEAAFDDAILKALRQHDGPLAVSAIVDELPARTFRKASYSARQSNTDPLRRRRERVQWACERLVLSGRARVSDTGTARRNQPSKRYAAVTEAA